jgi:1-deoxy-D-xylulose-5-phosphate synthase
VSTKYPLLETIDNPTDLKQLSLNQLPQLCTELRQFIIDMVLTHGGHFAANLGVVELTVALHFVFDTPEDKMVWDVGHQAYGHKILTNRRQQFSTNRKMGGLSGFPKMDESEFDAFGTGHSSTAISAILGMAVAARLEGKNHLKHIAIVGDGALTAGQAFEGLNNFSVSQTNSLIILNDNNIGIDPNTGAINKHFNTIDSKMNLFTLLGLTYFGPTDGHDILGLISVLSKLKQEKTPCVLHLKTIKGKGFTEAENEQTKWHSTSQFIKIEKPKSENRDIVKLKYQDVFGLTLVELAKTNEKIVGVTPAMPTGSGMIAAMNEYPNRFFDVGIAEQHAVTFAAGMATQGFIVFCSIYSTFLQRAIDQVIHDVCIQNLPVIFCIDRAGNVGDDGPTHHGMFDIPLLMSLPNLTIAAPSNGIALRSMMHHFAKHAKGPVAIRYPKGNIMEQTIDWTLTPEQFKLTHIRLVAQGNEIAILAFGTILSHCEAALTILKKDNIYASLYEIGICKPMDLGFLSSIFKTHKYILTIEDGTVIGGFGSMINTYYINSEYNLNIKNLGFPDKVIEHGSTKELFAKYKLDSEGIAHNVKIFMSK